MSNTAGSSILLLTNSPTSTIPITFTVSNSAIVGAGSMLDLIDASSIGAGVIVQASNFIADSTILLSSNITLSANSGLLLGSTASSTGVISIVGGTLVGSPSVGNGSLLISNGVLQAGSVNVGVLSGAHGLWQIAGGSNIVNSVTVGVVGSATGDVIVAGGELSPSGTISVGGQGLGRLITSNGLLHAGEVDLGLVSGGHGIWQIAGGSSTVSSIVHIGENTGATGEVFVTGGGLKTWYMALGGNGGPLSGGDSAGVGSLVISNGVVNVTNLYCPSWQTGVGTVAVAGGNLNVSLVSMAEFGERGVLWQTGGEIDVTNGNFAGILLGGGSAGEAYDAQLICSGGVLRATEVGVGQAFTSASSGSSSWIIAGGTSIVTRAVNVVNRTNQIGLLAISGGLLQTRVLEVGTLCGGGSAVVSGGGVQVTYNLDIGEAPGQPSQVTIGGGNLTAGRVLVGTLPGSVGTFAITGGVVNILPNLFHDPTLVVGGNGLYQTSAGTGTVWYTGGTLNVDYMTVGDTGFGSMFVSSNANFQPYSVVVGNLSGAVGQLSLQGGTFFPSPTRRVGNLYVGVSPGSTGTVWVTDGVLRVQSCFPSESGIGVQGSGRFSATNATLQFYGLFVGPNGTFECVNSQFETGFYGCPVVNSNMILFVNSTGEFAEPVQNFGSIVANNSTLRFTAQVNNSGVIVLTNGSAQFFGGINNTGAVLLGPDKFLITSICPTGSDVAIAWQGFTGNRYRVQAASSLTDAFSDVSSDITAPGSGLGTANYIHSGGLTNSANRFYRVRHIY